MTGKVLCRRDSNLLTADVALRFMLKKQRAQKIALGTDLANAPSRRRPIHHRRNNLSESYRLLCLQNPEAGDHGEDSNLFSVSTTVTAEIRKIVKELVDRLDYHKGCYVIDSQSRLQ